MKYIILLALIALNDCMAESIEECAKNKYLELKAEQSASTENVVADFSAKYPEKAKMLENYFSLQENLRSLRSFAVNEIYDNHKDKLVLNSDVSKILPTKIYLAEDFSGNLYKYILRDNKEFTARSRTLKEATQYYLFFEGVPEDEKVMLSNALTSYHEFSNTTDYFYKSRALFKSKTEDFCGL